MLRQGGVWRVNFQRQWLHIRIMIALLPEKLDNVLSLSFDLSDGKGGLTGHS